MRLLALLLALLLLPACLATSLSSLARAAILSTGAKHPLEYASSSLSRSPSVLRTLASGAALRIASDLTGGIPLENVKTKQALHEPSGQPSGRGKPLSRGLSIPAAIAELTAGDPTAYPLLRLWSGLPLRVAEGSLLGGAYLVSSRAARGALLRSGSPRALAALGGGLVGGLAQSALMTPTSVVTNRLVGGQGKTTGSVVREVVEGGGWRGFYAGFPAMAARQTTNWASRATFTELARSGLGLRRLGLKGEVLAGVVGGAASVWNTPIEVVRVRKQRDVEQGREGGKSYERYFRDIYENEGWEGLYRGVGPRCLQAVWQTNWMVVAPGVLGF